MSGTSTANLLPTPPQEDAWIVTYQKLIPHWQSVSRSQHYSTVPISMSRVNQFDAARLDIEMSAMSKEQLVEVFSVIKPGMLFQYEAELDAFLEFLIWRFSIWVEKPTPGNGLMNVRYIDESAIETRGKVKTGLEGPGLTVAQKIWYCIATVCGQYLWARLQSFSAFCRWEAFGMWSLGFDTMYWRTLQGCLVWQPTHISIYRKDNTSCPICQASPTIPYLAFPCQHSSCYYCLRTRCAAAPSFRCSRCSEPVVAMRRRGGRGDVKTHPQ